MLRSYAHAQSELESVGGYAWRARFEEILRGLSFKVEDADRPLSSFSGGELTRASLARVLAAQPDLLLLDEPTNHLDLRALEWLEDQLTALTCSILLVSHDRWFLERVATGILELEFGRSKHYAMGYSAYRREKAMALANQADAFERQQAEIERLQRFVDKFRAGTRSRQAQSKAKAIQRMQVEAPRRDRALAFGFSKVERSGRIVIEAEHLTLRAGDKPLLDDAGLVVERGQRVAVIGPNGAGKTTLVETLLDLRPPVTGRIKLGHNVTDRLLQPAHRRDARAPQRRRRDDARHGRPPQLDAVAHDPRQLPLHPGGGRPQGRRALGRRAAAARARGARRGRRQPARARRAHEPSRRRGARGARGGARRLRGHRAARLARPRADRRGRDAHGEHRESPHRAAPRRLQRLPRGRRRAPGRTAAARRRPAAKGQGDSAGAPRARQPAKRRPSQRTQRLVRDLESAIAKLESEQATLEATLADPANAGDHARLSELGTRYQQVQEELAWKLLEWERVQAGDGLEV